MEVKGQLHASASLPPGKNAVTHLIEGPRADMEVLKRNLLFSPEFKPVALQLVV
jgi:hypothetical protein